MIRAPDRTNYKQKVIIPKDTIKQDEIAVIEIPYEYQNEPVVVVKPKFIETGKAYNTINATNESLKMINKGNKNSNIKSPTSYEDQNSSFESVTKDSSLINQKDKFPKIYKKIITTTITEGPDGKIKKTTTTTTTQNRELASTTKLDTPSEKVNKGTTQEHKKKQKKKQVLDDTCGLHTPQDNSGMVLPDESINNSTHSSSGDSKLNYTESNLKLHTPKNIELVAAEKELELPKRSHTLIVTVPEKVVDKKNKSSKLGTKNKKNQSSKNSTNEEVRSFKKIIKKTTMTKSPTNDSSGLHADIQIKKSFEPCSSIPSQPLPCSLIGQMYVGEACETRPNHCGIQDNKLNRPNVNVNQFNEKQQYNKYQQMVNYNENIRIHCNDQFKPSNNFGKMEYNQINSGYIPSYNEPVKMQQGQIYNSAINTNNQMNNKHVCGNKQICTPNQGSFEKTQPGQMSYTYGGHNNANIINSTEMRGFVPRNEVNNFRNMEVIHSGQKNREIVTNENQMIQISNNRQPFIVNNQDYFHYNDQQIHNNFSPCNENTMVYMSDSKGNLCNIYQYNSDVVNGSIPSCISEESKQCNFLTSSEGSEVQNSVLNQVNTTVSRPYKNTNGNSYKAQQNQYITNNVQKEDFIAKMSLNSNFGIQPGQTKMDNANISPEAFILNMAQDNSAIMQSNLMNSTFNTSNNSNISEVNKEKYSNSNNLRTTQLDIESNQFSNDIKSGQIKSPVSTNVENSVENIQTNQMGNIVGNTSTGAGDTKPILKSSSILNNQSNMDTKQSSFDINKSANFLKTRNENSQELMQPNRMKSTCNTTSDIPNNNSNNITSETIIQQIPSSNLDSSLTSNKPEQKNNIFVSGSDVASKASVTNKQDNLDLPKSELNNRALNSDKKNNTNSSVPGNTQQSSLVNNSKNNQPENQKSNTLESIPSYKRIIKTRITRKTSEDDNLEIPFVDPNLSYVKESVIKSPTYKKVTTTTITKGPLDNNKLALLQSYRINNYFPNSNMKRQDPVKTSYDANFSNRNPIHPANLGLLQSYQTENNISLQPPPLYNNNLGTTGSNNYKFKYPIDYSKRLNSISGYSTISDTMGIFPHIYKGINTNPTKKNKYSMESSASENSFGLLPSAHLNTTDYFNNSEFKSNCNERKKTFNFPQFENNKNYLGLLPSSFLNRCASIEKSIGLLNDEFLHHKLLTLPRRPTETKKSCNSLLQSAPIVNKSLKINDSLELLNAKLENYNSMKDNMGKKIPPLLKTPEIKEYALLNQTLVKQLHKAETAEKVKLQNDLEKYQQARRQLITNASKLGTSKKENKFEK